MEVGVALWLGLASNRDCFGHRVDVLIIVEGSVVLVVPSGGLNQRPDMHILHICINAPLCMP